MSFLGEACGERLRWSGPWTGKACFNISRAAHMLACPYILQLKFRTNMCNVKTFGELQALTTLDLLQEGIWLRTHLVKNKPWIACKLVVPALRPGRALESRQGLGKQANSN